MIAISRRLFVFTIVLILASFSHGYSPNNQPPIEQVVAFMDGVNALNPDENTKQIVRRYKYLLDNIGRRFQISPHKASEVIDAGKQYLAEKGIKETMLNIMEAVNKKVADKTTDDVAPGEMSLLSMVSVYTRAREDGNHQEAVDFLTKSCVVKQRTICCFDKETAESLTKDMLKLYFEKLEAEEKGVEVDRSLARHLTQAFNRLIKDGDAINLESGQDVLVVESSGIGGLFVKIKVLGTDEACWPVYGKTCLDCE